jgi:mRNA interferase MazF
MPRGTRGHEQRGSRYAVVLQADELLILSTVVVAPTSTRAMPTTFRPEVTIRGRRTRVLVEQLGAVAPGRLGRPAGHLSPLELAAVDDALAVVLGLG